jgi:hypothetical protein
MPSLPLPRPAYRPRITAPIMRGIARTLVISPGVPGLVTSWYVRHAAAARAGDFAIM